jgi:hypothetical protein
MSARLASAAASTSRRASITGPERPAASSRLFADDQAWTRFSGMRAYASAFAGAASGAVTASPRLTRPGALTRT